MRIRGSDVVVHFMHYWSHQVDEATGLWELASLRLLRYALLDGKVQELNVEHTSLNVYLGSMILRLAEKCGEVHHAYCALSALLEGMKLAAALKGAKAPSMVFHAALREGAGEKRFRFLHEDIEHMPGSIRLGDIAEGGNQEAQAVNRLESGALVVLNTVKHDASKLDGLLRAVGTCKNPKGSLLLVFRTTMAEPRTVWNVLGDSFTLPSLYPLLARLWAAGWHVAYRYINDFDKDWLLPSGDATGVCMLHATRTRDELIQGEGFQIYDGKPSGDERGLTLFDARSLQSYDAMFTWDLPVLYLTDEPDWRRWADERKWDAACVNWNSHPLPNAGEVLALARHEGVDNTLDDDALDSLIAGLEHDERGNAIGMIGQAMLARCLELLGRNDDAVAAVRRTVQAAPHRADELSALSAAYGHAHCAMGREAAIVAIGVLPSLPLHQRIEVCRHALNETFYEAAFHILEPLQRDAPDNATVRYMSAVLATKVSADLSQPRKTLESLRSEQMPDDLRRDVVEELGILCARQGDISALAQCADELTRDFPHVMLGWALLGFAEFKAGRADYHKRFEQAAALGQPHVYADTLVNVILHSKGIVAEPSSPFAERVSRINSRQ